jgi:hypothetical protein
MCRGRAFVTGGHHLCSGHELTVEAPDPGDGTWFDRLARHSPDPMRVRERLAFLCNAYTLPLASTALIERFDRNSPEFFAATLAAGGVPTGPTQETIRRIVPAVAA